MRVARAAWVSSFIMSIAAAAAAQGSAIPEPRFTDPTRAGKLAAAFPEIDRIVTAWVARAHVPGAAMGIIIDGQLAWVKTIGVTDTASRAPVTADSVFRIASMTKSFTALAILKLRDEGKLSLDDPAAKYVPELTGLPYPTKDAPAITIRHLLTHSEGFPEDNPWGDRQLAQPHQTMSTWMKEGIPFSTVPGTAYEYSNYGFAILGQIVERVSKQPYDQYMAAQILRPLGMHDSTFDLAEIPAVRRARGYRWEDETWKEEPVLGHGTFGAMGGLWTSLNDLARYVTYQMAAWPPRDAADERPVKRSSLREQQQAARWQRTRTVRSALDRPLEIYAAAYGYGLRISQTCRFAHVVGHGGGLPGFGSLMMWLPEYGVGLIAMGNLTYAGWGGVFNDSLDALAATGALQPRVAQPSPALVRAKADVSRLVASWDNALAERVVADNFFLDQSADRWRAPLQQLGTAHGSCRAEDGIDAENALRGTWRMTCDRGSLRVEITLAPTQPPRVQYLLVHPVMPPGPAMTAAIERARDRIATEAADWGACRVGEAVGGDGVRLSSVRLECQKGRLIGTFRVDEAGELTSLYVSPAREQVCVP